jgi:hypothetical protein
VFHPNNKHHGGGPLPIQPVDAPLYVVTAISNPRRYTTRYHRYRAFEPYIENSGAILYTIEQGFGEREFEITDANNPRHIRIQTNSEIWHKENMLNIAIQHLPDDWKYVAWIDADVTFARPDWVYETIHLLQHYEVIQMFSQAADLDPKHKVLDGLRDGIVAHWMNEGQGSLLTGNCYGYGYGYGHGAGNKHPGYAWAARRGALDHLGGLIDWAIVGSADWHMASALMGQLDASIGPSVVQECPRYVEFCKIWEHNAIRHLKYNIGFMEGLLMHHWHGKKFDRKYFDRWRILVDSKFDPMLDLKRDWQGLYQLTDRNHVLRDDLRKYMAQRNEDSIDK